MKYAKIIIDISAEQVDRAFTYRIPEELADGIVPGCRVRVPFGTGGRCRSGYVIEITDIPGFDEQRIKDIAGLMPGALSVDSKLISLAAYMADEYGCTMNQALIAVLPVKSSVRKNSRRTDPVKRIDEAGLSDGKIYELNTEQQRVFDEITKDPLDRPHLIYGITGSGKTRIYIELIRTVIEKKKQAIVLVPEISLTYQTVGELTRYFGERVAVMHSKLSSGERYEQFVKTKNGGIDVMVGPRSALFAPFKNLGLIIIDEEHEHTYRSDTSPRYDAREVAKVRAGMDKAMLVLGSATPSLESYKKALDGEYALHVIKQRAHPGARLPDIHIVDMRQEMSAGNRSIFSGMLRDMISERLERKEQVMLFLNRRGYAGFVSCRSCGTVLKCPHCDVSLTAHNNWYTDPHTGKRAALLKCHYCGYTAPMPETCPSCGSRYIAPFGTGTQKLEQEVKKIFPAAGLLRMDADTTAARGSYENILSSFREHKADILIGTQMIVKGHDFPGVTLVGIVAADMSLNTSEYDASERTYQLITQAAGRSGRGERPGDVVIQSYDPSHYALTNAALRSYEDFYARELSYRRLMKYPPEIYLLSVRFKSESEAAVIRASELARSLACGYEAEGAIVIGPCDEAVYKINDNYRKILYIKHDRHDIIIKIRSCITERLSSEYGGRVYLSCDVR